MYYIYTCIYIDYNNYNINVDPGVSEIKRKNIHLPYIL